MSVPDAVRSAERLLVLRLLVPALDEAMYEAWDSGRRALAPLDPAALSPQEACLALTEALDQAIARLQEIRDRVCGGPPAPQNGRPPA